MAHRYRWIPQRPRAFSRLRQRATLLGFTKGVPAGDTFRKWWRNRLGKRWRDATETIVTEYFRPELADHLLDMGLPAGGSLFDVEYLINTPRPSVLTRNAKPSSTFARSSTTCCRSDVRRTRRSTITGSSTFRRSSRGNTISRRRHRRVPRGRRDRTDRPDAL
jgi:hypothetical protein